MTNAIAPIGIFAASTMAEFAAQVEAGALSGRDRSLFYHGLEAAGVRDREFLRALAKGNVRRLVPLSRKPERANYLWRAKSRLGHVSLFASRDNFVEQVSRALALVIASPVGAKQSPLAGLQSIAAPPGEGSQCTLEGYNHQLSAAGGGKRGRRSAAGGGSVKDPFALPTTTEGLLEFASRSPSDWTRLTGKYPWDLDFVKQRKKMQTRAVEELVRRADRNEEDARRALQLLSPDPLVSVAISGDEDKAIALLGRLAAEGNSLAVGYLYHYAYSAGSDESKRPWLETLEQARRSEGSRVDEILESFKTQSAAARLFTSKEDFVRRGSNNFYMFFIPASEEDLMAKRYWNYPAAKRFRQEHSELNERIVALVPKWYAERTSSYSWPRSPLYVETQEALYEAHQIMAGYTDLIDIYDPAKLLR